MTEQTNPPPLPCGTGGNPLRAVLWLFVAFIPSLVSIPLLGVKNMPQWAGIALLFFAAACCLCSGFGVFSRMENGVARIILGLIVAVGFFVLNVIIVLFIGCSMGQVRL